MGLLDGKAAVVTGAGRGIGRGEALELATQGAKVVVNDIGTSIEGDGRDERVADAVVVEIRESGGEAVANYDDISTWDGARALIDQAVEHYGRLDVVVNNAGNLRDSAITDMSEDDWDAVIRVHLKGSFLTTRHAASYWRSEKSAGRHPRAAVINTSSRAGLPGDGGRADPESQESGAAEPGDRPHNLPQPPQPPSTARPHSPPVSPAALMPATGRRARTGPAAGDAPSPGPPATPVTVSARAHLLRAAETANPTTRTTLNVIFCTVGVSTPRRFARRRHT